MYYSTLDDLCKHIRSTSFFNCSKIITINNRDYDIVKKGSYYEVRHLLEEGGIKLVAKIEVV